MNIPDDLFPILKDDFNKIMYLYSSEQLPLEKDVINFWKDAIYGYCLMTKSLLVSRDNIYKAFEISDIEPVSLLPAFRYLVSKGDLVPSSMSSSSSSSSSNLLSASLSWVTYLSSFLSKQLDQSTNSGEEQVIFTPMLYFLTQAIILRYVNSSYPTGVSVYLRPPPGCSSAALVANTHECETFKDLLHLLATDSYQSSVNTSNNKVVYVRALLSDLPDTQYDILAQHLIKTGAATLSADGFAIHIHGGKLASSVSSEAEFAKLALRQTLSSVRTRISTCDRRATEYVKQAKEFKVCVFKICLSF